MNFALGFYRTRNGTIVEITVKNETRMIGHTVTPTAQRHPRDFYWNFDGNADYYNIDFDLIEYLPHYPEEPARRQLKLMTQQQKTISESLQAKILVLVKQKDKPDEILSLATAREEFCLDLYDSEALRRGHTLHYPCVTLSKYEANPPLPQTPNLKS